MEGVLIVKVKVLAQYLLLPAPPVQNAIITLFTRMAGAGPRQPLAKFQRFFANSFFPALLEYYLTLSDSARIHTVVLLLRALIGDASFFAPALLASPYASTFSLNTPHAGLLCEEDRLYLQVVQRMLAQKKFLHYYKTHADPLRRCAETVTLFLRCQDLETVQSTAAKAAVVFKSLMAGLQPCFVQDLDFLLPLFAAITDVSQQLAATWGVRSGKKERRVEDQKEEEEEEEDKKEMEEEDKKEMEEEEENQANAQTTTQPTTDKKLLLLKARWLAEALLGGDAPQLTPLLHYLSQSLLMHMPLLPVPMSSSLHPRTTSSRPVAAPLPSRRLSPSPSTCTSPTRYPLPPSTPPSTPPTLSTKSPTAFWTSWSGRRASTSSTT